MFSRQHGRSLGGLDPGDLDIGGEEPEGQLLGPLHLRGVAKVGAHLLDVLGPDPGLEDVPEVTEGGHVAHLAAGDQLLPLRLHRLGLRIRGVELLLPQGGQLGLPGVGRLEGPRDDLVEEDLLGRVLRLGVHQEQRILELHRLAVTVVLGELVLVEAVEGLLQPVLDAPGELPELFDPVGRVEPLVAHQKLGDFVGAEHGPGHGLRHEVVPAVHLRQEGQQHQGDAPQVHLRAGVDGEFRHELRADLADEPRDTVHAVRLPLIVHLFQSRGHDGSVQLHLGSHTVRLRPFVVHHHVLSFQHSCDLHGFTL